MMGHSLIRSLLRSTASLTRLLSTARALCTARSFARSLIRFPARGTVESLGPIFKTFRITVHDRNWQNTKSQRRDRQMANYQSSCEERREKYVNLARESQVNIRLDKIDLQPKNKRGKIGKNYRIFLKFSFFEFKIREKSKAKRQWQICHIRRSRKK